MKVLVITQYFPPESALLPYSVAKGLADTGHQVRVITGFPNYPTGRVFDGYKQQWRQREVIDGMDVLRVPLWADHSLNSVKRMLNYATFGVSSASARRFARGADVIYVYATQMTPALGPWLWRMIGGAPYVLHVQDLWPDSITGSSLVEPGLKARLMSGILNLWLTSVYRRASGVIGIAPTMVETLIRRGVDSSKAHLCFNWAPGPADRAAGGPMPEMTDREGCSIVFAGNVGDMQDLETVVYAAHRARDTGLQVTIVGEGVALPRLQQVADGLGCGNVEFRKRVPREEVARVYAKTDFSLVTLKNLQNFRGTVPSKFQASLAYGVPVITTVQGDVRGLVEQLDVGFTADAESVESLEAAFRRAAASTAEERQSMAARARRAYAERFSQSAGVKAIEGILTRAARSRPDTKQPHAEKEGR